MSDRNEAAKRTAAEAVLNEVRDGMRIGLGTGSTARWVIEGVARLVSEGYRVEAVATSAQTARLATALGIPIVPLTAEALDVALDGADEIDPQGNLIKGGGGALLREKLVALAARRFVVVADISKRTAQLGTRWAVPVEIVAWGWEQTALRLAAYQPTLRRDAAGQPTLTDNGNYLVDCAVGQIADVATLDAALKAVTGVVETGLFVGLAHRIVLAGPDGVAEWVRG